MANNPFTGASAGQTPHPMCDKDHLFDALSSEKFATANYNTFANECKCPALRNDLMILLKEEHDIQFSIFQEADKRGWYPVPPAQQQMVDQAKQKFTNMMQG